MSTNKQRRESERQRLQRQLEERRRREAARRRNTTIASVVGALVLVAAVVVIVVVASSGSSKKKSPYASQPSSSPTTTASTSATTAACGQTTFPTKKYPAASGTTVSFDGVTVKGATDLKGEPVVTSKSGTAPKKIEVKDLVVGKGAAAKASSCVDVQYSGVLYKTGKAFDSSWSRGQVAEFSLSGVVAGFTQGIGGTTGIAPMKVGGRRIIILPASLGYGSQANQSIPANSPLVFVVDLVAINTKAA